MQTILGTLSINGLNSMLLPQNALLLLAGFPDSLQAARAATDLIRDIKGIPSGAAVAVTGTPDAIGGQPAIVMSDIVMQGA
jgi:hypothetical protein